MNSQPGPEMEVAPKPQADLDRWSYEAAFARNLGLVSEPEQGRLRKATVAIAGLGGVGGGYALTLARMGVGGFRLADPDTFSVANFNRQAGATGSSVGQNKAETIGRMVLDINPEARVWTSRAGIDPGNIDTFLDGADLALDGIDFFALEARRLLFARAREKGLWVLSAGPLGFSTAFLAFSPKGMSFDAYMDLRPGMTREEQLIAFLVGIAPRATHQAYMDFSKVNVESGAGPSLGAACQLCSGVIGVASLAILLGRPPSRPAPAFSQFDPYRGLYRRGRLRWGNRGPLQRLKRVLVARMFKRLGLSLSP